MGKEQNAYTFIDDRLRVRAFVGIIAGKISNNKDSHLPEWVKKTLSPTKLYRTHNAHTVHAKQM